MNLQDRAVAAFEARTHLGELIDYVRYAKQPCFIERHGKRVAALLDIESYERVTLPQRYWKSVREAVARLRDHYQPTKIVLFGSLAQGEIHEGSDIDLLIIKETSRRRPERIEEILKLLPLEAPIEPHVYTPDELRQRLKQKDPFLTQALHQGILLYEAQA